MLLIKTKEAAIKHGRKTTWCISYDDSGKDNVDEGEGNRFDLYSLSEDEPSIYFVISKINDEKFAILKSKYGSYAEIKDKNNDDVTIQYILSKYNLPESIFKPDPITDQERFNLLIQNPYNAYIYAHDVLQRRWPEAEPYIMKEPWSAYGYAKDLMEGKRWPEAEPYIMKDPGSAYFYATDIIKDRWPEAEPYIMKDPGVWRRYTDFFGDAHER